MVLILVGIFLLIASVIIHALKMKTQKEEIIPVGDFHLNMDREELDQEVQMFRSLVDESVEKVRKEYEKIVQTQEKLEKMLMEATESIKKMEKLREEISLQLLQKQEPQDNPESAPQSEVAAFLHRDISLEDVAQQLNMGIGELKLRLSLLKKENLYYANRK